MITNSLTVECIETAKKHVTQAVMQSSAQLCIEDAQANLAKGDVDYAYARALKSLKYSIGIFADDYQKFAKLLPIRV